MTFEEYSLHFLNSSALNPKSKKNFSFTLSENVFPVIGDFDLSAITPDDTDRVVKFMLEKHATEPTIRNCYRLMKQIFHDAVISGALITNPCAFQYTWNKDPDFSFPASLKQHQQLIFALNCLPLRNLYGFCYFTGISIAKALTIKKKEVFSEKEQLILHGTTNEGLVQIPLNAVPYVIAAYNLHNALGVSESTPLFLRNDGKHITSNDIWACTHILRTVLGIPSFKSRSICRCYHNIMVVTNGKYV